MSCFIHCISLLLLLFHAAHGVAAGQSPATADADSSGTIHEMGEVVISGSVSGFVPSGRIVLDTEQIRDRGAATVDELLCGESGLALTTGAKAETEFRIRGFPATASMVLLDGHPLSVGYYGKVDLAMLALEPVASITVLKGPASVAYGPGAMGGIVNIMTRQPPESARTAFEAEIGDLAARRLGLHHSRHIRSWSYALSLYEQSRNAFPLSSAFEPRSLEDGGSRDNSAQRLYGAQVRLGYAASDRERYALVLGAHGASRDVPTTIYAWDSPTYRRFPSMYRSHASLSINRDLRSSTRISALLYSDISGDNLVEYRNAAYRSEDIVYDSQFDHTSFGGNVALQSGFLEGHDLGAGVWYKQDIVDRQPDIDRSLITHRFRTASLYLEDVFRPWARGVVTIGLSQTAFTHPTASDIIGRLCPMIGMTQNIVSDMQLNAGIARVVRFPSAQQLFSESSGNPDLLPEDAWKAEVGIGMSVLTLSQQMTFSVEVVGHWSELRNLIHRTSKSYSFRNIATARLYGGEVKGSVRIANWLDFDCSFDHLVRDARSAEMLQNIAPGTLRLAIRFRTHGITFRHEFGSHAMRETQRSDFRLPAYSVHNTSLSVRIPGNILLRARIQNLLDEDYQEETGYPAAGRMVFLGASWDP